MLQRGWHGNLVNIAAVPSVLRQVNVCHRAGGAVGAGEAGCLGLDAARYCGVGGAGDGGVEALNAEGLQGEEFACVGNAVLIQVAPDLELGEVGIDGIDNAVAVAVQIGEGGKTIVGSQAVGNVGAIAEHFRAVVDAAIAIHIPHQNPVVAANPTRRGADAVVVQIKQRARHAVGSHRFNAVVV